MFTHIFLITIDKKIVRVYSHASLFNGCFGIVYDTIHAFPDSEHIMLVGLLAFHSGEKLKNHPK